MTEPKPPDITGVVYQTLYPIVQAIEAGWFRKILRAAARLVSDFAALLRRQDKLEADGRADAIDRAEAATRKDRLQSRDDKRMALDFIDRLGDPASAPTIAALGFIQTAYDDPLSLTGDPKASGSYGALPIVSQRMMREPATSDNQSAGLTGTTDLENIHQATQRENVKREAEEHPPGEVQYIVSRGIRRRKPRR